jgi:hypothetical protein
MSVQFSIPNSAAAATASSGQSVDRLAYTIRELATASTLSVAYLYNEVIAGRLVLTKHGRRSVVLAEHAKAWLRGQTGAAA